MKEIVLNYNNTDRFNAYIVRYFKFENNKYLIYSLKEYDERGYIKLYVVKIMKELNMLVTQTVRRPDEWKQMKNIIKHILVELRNNQLKCIEDLNPLELEDIIIYETKSFWMAADLVEKLAIDNTITSDAINNNKVENKINEEVSTLKNIKQPIVASSIKQNNSDSEELEILEL